MTAPMIFLIIGSIAVLVVTAAALLAQHLERKFDQ